MVDIWLLLFSSCCRQVSIVVSLVVWYVSGSMVDIWLLLLSSCCRQVSIVVSLVVW